LTPPLLLFLLAALVVASVASTVAVGLLASAEGLLV
jgi:hypothetical protein